MVRDACSSQQPSFALRQIQGSGPPPAPENPPNIRLNCGESASESPQPPELAGAAGIDLSVEVTTAALPGDIQRGSAISAQIEAQIGGVGSLDQ
jgi:hypothetical protein